MSAIKFADSCTKNQLRENSGWRSSSKSNLSLISTTQLNPTQSIPLPFNNIQKSCTGRKKWPRNAESLAYLRINVILGQIH